MVIVHFMLDTAYLSSYIVQSITCKCDKIHNMMRRENRVVDSRSQTEGGAPCTAKKASAPFPFSTT